ncbi:MAG: hypothetical protein NVSMB6_05740 [Burkholderiaceae bacterium]
MKKQWLAMPLGGIIVATMLVAFPAVGTTLAAIVTCGSTAPCDGGSNSSTGPGVQGSSRKGNGVYGTTNSPSENAGVFGKDTTVFNIHNAGVKGTSKNGVGVEGFSETGAGVAGTNGGSAGVGVQGIGDGLGVWGSGTLIGVRGDGDTDGVFAVGNHYGVEAVAYGLSGTAVSGYGGQYGVVGSGPTDGVTGANEPDTAGTAVLAQGNTVSGFLFRGNNTNNSDVFTVDNSGNGYFTGQVSARAVVTHAAPTVAQATATGARATTYASQATQANVEHIGEADLVGGVATVHFDPRFAAILARGHYMVFLTPQGPTQGGLYVSQKGPGGFVVRSENPSARSNVAFDYRVVGRPYSTQLNTGTDTLQRNTPAGPIHGPKMMRRKFADYRHKLGKRNFQALPVIK